MCNLKTAALQEAKLSNNSDGHFGILVANFFLFTFFLNCKTQFFSKVNKQIVH